jgi:hypothetical protein
VAPDASVVAEHKQSQTVRQWSLDSICSARLSRVTDSRSSVHLGHKFSMLMVRAHGVTASVLRIRRSRFHSSPHSNALQLLWMSLSSFVHHSKHRC